MFSFYYFWLSANGQFTPKSHWEVRTYWRYFHVDLVIFYGVEFFTIHFLLHQFIYLFIHFFSVKLSICFFKFKFYQKVTVDGHKFNCKSFIFTNFIKSVYLKIRFYFFSVIMVWQMTEITVKSYFLFFLKLRLLLSKWYLILFVFI